MFENAEYQDLFDKINNIRSYGLNKMLTIPQIAILGDQSSGKSSVLEAITKLSFPRNIETCTRFATQVNIRRSKQVKMSAYIDGEADFNKRHLAKNAASDIHPIINEANGILCSNVEISEKVLEITISGPTLSPLTIIDLPGYINTTVDGQGKGIVEKIRAINTRYIKDNRTIILAVVPANVDLNNIYVLGEAERYDKSNERTIPIVTKPDTVEADLLPNLIQILLNKRKFMKRGYLVMKNSSFKDIDTSWDEAKQLEDDFFRSSEIWGQVPEARKGRVSVEKFLAELLYTHIKKELPHLKKEILKLVGSCEKEITSLGHEVSSLATARTKYFECILALKGSLTSVLEGNYSQDYLSKHKLDITKRRAVETRDTDTHIDDSNGIDDDSDDVIPPLDEGDDHFIRSTLYRLYQSYNLALNRQKYILGTDKMTELVLRYKGGELPGFISFTTFTQIYMETLICWRDRTKEHITNMHLYLYNAVTNFIMVTAEPALQDLFLLNFDKFYTVQTAKMDEAIDNIFTDESTPFTMNKYYYDHIIKSRTEKAEKHIKDLLAKYGDCYGDVESVKLQISDINYNEKLATEDLQEMLLSYCKVSRKRIVDVVLLQTIERHMLKQINLYFDMLIAVDDSAISSRLLDSPTKLARRQEFQDKVSVLRKSLRQL
ncbi:hypothetical protein BGZ83_005315 [Gryganskiella cystojenkinii]|nr:hypothetical protein BGZ83_005315 [Gryganskiella cystojenkinii]